MTTRRLLASSCMLIAAITLAGPSTSLGAGDRTPVAIVVSKSVPVDGIAFGDLKRLYMGGAVLAGGKSLVPLTYPTRTPDRVNFDKTVLGMSADEAALYWTDRKIRGQSGPPKSVESPDVIIKVVSRTEKAIGFVRTKTIGSDVKVLRIDGKLPTDPGYRLVY